MRPALLKALAFGPGVLISTALTCSVAPALPTEAGSALFYGGIVLAGLTSTTRGERVVAALLLRARRLTSDEHEALSGALTLVCRAQLGPPLVELRLGPDSSVTATGFGRRTVVVSRALLEAVEDHDLPAEQAAAVIAHAAALVRRRLVRADPLLTFWSLPWLVVQATAGRVAAVLRHLPGTSRLWRSRAVLVAVAVIQTAAQHRPLLAIALTAIGVLSYAMPQWAARWRATVLAAGDDAVIAAGLGERLDAFLARCARTPEVRARRRQLRCARPVAPPPLGLVR